MTDRDIDQQLVERVQRGDKGAFDLLVSKYQRKIFRLLSRLIRDHAEIEDVAQEAFIKAYRALPNFRGDSAFYTWLYRIAINTAKNHLVSQGRRAPTSTEADIEEAETFDDGDHLRDLNTPESMLRSKAGGRGGESGDRRVARGPANRHRAARNRGPELRRDCRFDELPDRDRAFAYLSRPRGHCPGIEAGPRHG